MTYIDLAPSFKAVQTSFKNSFHQYLRFNITTLNNTIQGKYKSVMQRSVLGPSYLSLMKLLIFPLELDKMAQHKNHVPQSGR